MLRSAKELRGYELRAIDGKIGEVQDLYFDDWDWRIRYLVAGTGGWLSTKQVLLSPLVITGVPKEKGQIEIALTTDQIRRSPDVDTARPVSRQQEMQLHNYYGWRFYGADEGSYGVRQGRIPGSAAPESRDQSKLRSAKEVTGYGISATDERLGHVEDLVIDDGSWHIRHLIVDTAALWFGKKVLVAPELVQSVDWSRREVAVGLTAGELKDAPEWDGELPVDPEYDGVLLFHHERTTYLV